MIFEGFGGDGRGGRKRRGFRIGGMEEMNQNWSKWVWIEFRDQKAPFFRSTGSGQL